MHTCIRTYIRTNIRKYIKPGSFSSLELVSEPRWGGNVRKPKSECLIRVNEG